MEEEEEKRSGCRTRQRQKSSSERIGTSRQIRAQQRAKPNYSYTLPTSYATNVERTGRGNVRKSNPRKAKQAGRRERRGRRKQTESAATNALRRSRRTTSGAKECPPP